MKNNINIAKGCLSFLLILLLFPIINCSRVDTSWHKYKERNFEIVGKNRNFITVVSDGWKIIDKADKGQNSYEWGWEITIRTLNDPSLENKITDDGHTLTPVILINEIRYTLFDKDGFELVTDKMISQKTAMIVQEYGKTETYRQTATIPKSKAVRAANSSYLVIVE